MIDSTYNLPNWHRGNCAALRAMIRIHFFALLIPALFAQGCIIMPTGEDKVLSGRQVTAEQLAFIRPGVTVKSEIIERLGEPDVFWEDERIFAYNWQMRTGILVPLAGHPLKPTAALHIPVRYILLIQFDPNDRVKRFEVTRPSAFDSYGEHLEQWLKQAKDQSALAAP